MKMTNHIDRKTSTELISNSESTSYKLIIKYGDNIKEKIFDGKNAYKRAITFQSGINEIMKLAQNIKR
tara:strand:- start:889 stop:1092 length:204 start_codon:yes stop_codon:yes gene_type:complete